VDIKILFLDVDGTITDGKYYVSVGLSEEQEVIDGVMDKITMVSKSFYTRDFDALERLSKTGVEINFITSSDGRVLSEKFKSITNYHVDIYFNISDKKKTIDFILDDIGLNWDNVAYIGDAENDIECVEKAGFSCCPNDAIPEIKEKVDFVSTYNGGNGAVWEFVKEILKINMLKGEINE